MEAWTWSWSLACLWSDVCKWRVITEDQYNAGERTRGRRAGRWTSSGWAGPVVWMRRRRCAGEQCILRGDQLFLPASPCRHSSKALVLHIPPFFPWQFSCPLLSLRASSSQEQPCLRGIHSCCWAEVSSVCQTAGPSIGHNIVPCRCSACSLAASSSPCIRQQYAQCGHGGS